MNLGRGCKDLMEKLFRFSLDLGRLSRVYREKLERS